MIIEFQVPFINVQSTWSWIYLYLWEFKCFPRTILLTTVSNWRHEHEIRAWPNAPKMFCIIKDNMYNLQGSKCIPHMHWTYHRSLNRVSRTVGFKPRYRFYMSSFKIQTIERQLHCYNNEWGILYINYIRKTFKWVLVVG